MANCRTCAEPLGALDETGEESPECIRCWLADAPAERGEQMELFGGEQRDHIIQTEAP